ncbi:MAG: NTP transferase domain-containing protein [Pseudomonadota bacterium]
MPSADPRIFVAVLAAGSSQRFGADDKLATRFREKRLGEHVCDSFPVERLAPAMAWVIASQFGHPCQSAWERAGFKVAVNPEHDQGMGTSIALAMRMAARADCEALLIALADMPFVPTGHFHALLDAYDGPDSLICSSDGQTRMPPAILGNDRIAADDFGGDQGARAILSEGDVITCPSEWLIDIDTLEDLTRHGQ